MARFAFEFHYIAPPMDLDAEAVKARIAALKTEHSDLDQAIARLVEQVPANNLHLQRLKKRKLGLKDMIAKLENSQLPDIIA
jgi:hypothetical protein